MNNKTNIFQIVLLCILGASLVVGVLIFAGVIPGFRKDVTNTNKEVVMWGTLPAGALNKFFSDLNRSNDSFVVHYDEKSAASFEKELIDALARGRGPDLIILSDDMIVRYADILSPLPYTSLSARDYRDLFIDGAQIFLMSAGTLAVPLTVDPLVMYYNKDLYIQSGIIQPPKNWSAFLANHQKLNRVTNQGFIEQSGVAMGQFSNINNAKEILVSLLLQIGTPIIERGQSGYQVVLAGNPAVSSAIDFFTRFSTPGRAEYSWNASLPEAKVYFGRGVLAHYFGFASELNSLRKVNPNLNLDVTLVPSTAEGKPSVSYSRFQGVSVLKASPNKGAAYQVMTTLAARENNAAIAEITGLPSVRRDLLGKESTNPYQDVFIRAAFTAKAWYDPNPITSRVLFGQAVQRIISGVSNTSEVITSLQAQLANSF